MINRYKAPFIHTEKNDAYLSASHLLSLIPVMAVAVVFYGFRAAILLLSCSLLFAVSDDVCSRIRNISRGSILNPLFCGAAYALLLPPDTPVYIALSGVLFASLVVRQLPGGRGASFVNAPAAGRLFIRIVFPGNENALAMPGADRMSLSPLLFGSKGFDGVDLSSYYASEILTGRYPSFLGTACAFMILAGIIYLIVKRAVRFYGPACFILMLTALLLLKDLHDETTVTGMFLLTSGVLYTAAYLLFDEENTKSFGMLSVVSAFLCASLTFLMSFKASGIDLIVVPAVVTSALTGIIDYAAKVLRTGGEERLHV